MPKYYQCKIFTPEFLAKVNQYIEASVEADLIAKNIDPTKVSFKKAFLRIETRQHLNMMWNYPEAYEKYPDAKQYYVELGLFTPECTVSTFIQAEIGYQSQPRIYWKDEIKKIDDIDEIYSFIEIESELAL